VGIVNTVRQAQRSAGPDRIHAIIGGFHLIGAKPAVIQSTVADIKAMKPDRRYAVRVHGVSASSGRAPDRTYQRRTGPVST
jgi:7,8-dihydropterin-6-yl-methyl-4-(beta-D-ribofuranosyl)aminobenzene 5'-phosphate synthase